MFGIDTNVLVCFLVRDDEVQFEKARSLVKNGVSAGRRGFVNHLYDAEGVRTATPYLTGITQGSAVLAQAADRVRAMGGQRCAQGLRKLSLVALDAHSRVVLRRVARQ